MDTTKLDAYLPLIDTRDEETVFQQASDRVSAESEGLINDFSDNAPNGVLLRAQAFTHAEMLYRVNQFTLNVLLKFLAITGATRRLGKKARASLTVTLTTVRPVPFTLPADFEVRAGNLSFRTIEQLTIPAGATSGVVSAEAVDIGAKYNVVPGRITTYTRPLVFLGTITNLEAADGGEDEQPIEDAINEAIALIRTRNLVSPDDFTNAAQDVLGNDSRVKTIGLLGPDKVSEKLGAVHLFCASAQGTPSNVAQIQAVESSIRPRLMLGTSLYVSPMEFAPVSLRIFCKTNESVRDPNEFATHLWEAYAGYLSLRRFDPGSTVFIAEVMYQLRQVAGMRLIDYILLNEEPRDVPMPNAFTLPDPSYMVAHLSDVNTQTYIMARGTLDDL